MCSLLLSECPGCSVSDLPLQGLRSLQRPANGAQGGPGCMLCCSQTPQPVRGQGSKLLLESQAWLLPLPNVLSRPVPRVPVLRLIRHHHQVLLILGGPCKLPHLHDCWGRLLLFSCSVMSDPRDCSTPGLPVLHQFPERAQTHVHRVGDAIQPSHPLCPLLLPPSIFPSIRFSSNELVLLIRWPHYWSFSISPSNEDLRWGAN